MSDPKGGDIYVADVADAKETTGGNTSFREDGTSHTTQRGDGWSVSWGTSDRHDDNPHGHDHRSCSDL